MTKFIINGKATSYSSNPEISVGKKFIPIKQNMVSMLPATLVRVDGNVYALEQPIIVWTEKSVDFIVSTKPQLTLNRPENYKKVIKRLKKLIAEYEGKFQFGLEYSDLEMLNDAKAALVKYKLLSKFSLSLEGGAHD